MAAWQNVSHRKDHVTDLRDSSISWVSYADHNANKTFVLEVVSDCADSRSEGISDDSRTARDEDCVRNDIGTRREIYQFAVFILGQDFVDVCRVICLTISIDRARGYRLDIQNLGCFVVLVSRWRNRVILISRHKRRSPVGYDNLPFNTLFAGAS